MDLYLSLFLLDKSSYKIMNYFKYSAVLMSAGCFLYFYYYFFLLVKC